MIRHGESRIKKKPRLRADLARVMVTLVDIRREGSEILDS